jgi:YHS domain-containing protein
MAHVLDWHVISVQNHIGIMFADFEPEDWDSRLVSRRRLPMNQTDLDHLIQTKLQAIKERKQVQENHVQQRMREFGQRHQRFTAIADRIMETFIRPRMEKLLSYFSNAKFLPADNSGKHHCTLCFEHTSQYPATAKLELAVSRDGQCETLLVLYNLDILPIFFQFQGNDQVAMPLEQWDEKKIADWTDQKIIDFVDTYLRLETVDQYQADNVVDDPVCGMRVNKAFAAAKIEYNGVTYYFCLGDCQKKFARNPEQYLVVAIREKESASPR